MNKKEQARKFLKEIGMPEKQQSDLCCLTLLAMANIDEYSDWSEATNNWIRIHDIIQFVNNNYKCDYAENSRETFRKSAIHHFRNAAIIEDNGVATNSPNYRYRLTNEVIGMLKELDTDKYDSMLKEFTSNYTTLKEQYASKKSMQKMPVKINGKDFSFSPGKHNQLQKSILEEFAPRFAPNSECLYVGDTTEKDLFKNE